MTTAKVQLGELIIGFLYWDENRHEAIFEADEAYINSAINISPILHPDKKKQLFGSDFHSKFNGLLPMFNDSLPDSFGNTIFKEWLVRKDINSSDLNPVEHLLYVGARGIGGLEYQQSKAAFEFTEHLNLLELADISDKIIHQKYEQKEYLFAPEALQNILSIGSSVGGAQAKVLVAINEKNELLAGDITHTIPVEYYIVKLEHDTQNLWNREKNKIEFTYNELARKAGIHVADSRLITEGNRCHFASKRFDRNNTQKTHQQTVNALSGFYGRNNEFGYSEIFKIIDFLGLSYENSEQLFRQMVFNIAASNRDDHTKNFSFLLSESGKWSLSPAYDLTFPFDPHQSFYMPHQIHVNSKNKDITKSDVIAVAKKAGIRNASSIIEEVCTSVADFNKEVAVFDVNKNTISLIRKDIERNLSFLK